MDNNARLLFKATIVSLSHFKCNHFQGEGNDYIKDYMIDFSILVDPANLTKLINCH